MAKKSKENEHQNPIVEVASTFVSSPKYRNSVEQMGFGELMDDTYDNPNNKDRKNEKDT